MRRRRSDVAVLGPPDPVLVHYSGSDPSIAPVTCIVSLHGRVPALLLCRSEERRASNGFKVLSLMTMIPKNQMTKDQGQGSLLVRDFHYILNYLLIESFDRLVESFPIESQYS